MQNNLLARIAAQSDECAQRMHRIPAVAKHYAQHQAHSQMQNTECSGTSSFTKYTLFGKLHRARRDANGRTLPAVICERSAERWALARQPRDGYQSPSTRGDFAGAQPHPDIAALEPGPQYSMFWYRNNKLHREEYDDDGNLLPAVIRAPKRALILDPEFTPAIVFPDTSPTYEYWINGVRIE